MGERQQSERDLVEFQDATGWESEHESDEDTLIDKNVYNNVHSTSSKNQAAVKHQLITT